MKTINEYLKDDYEKWYNKEYIWIKKEGKYIPKTFGNFIDNVQSVSKALINRGFKNKKSIIFSENSYEWMVLDLSLMGYVGVCIPIDKEWTSHDIQNVLKSVDISLIMYSKTKTSIIEELKEKYINLETICIDDEFENLVKEGKGLGIKLEEIPLENVAKIIFTSGTTDIPKAIPLTQKNMFSNWDTLYKRTGMSKNDRSFICLPLNHVYSGVANFLYTIISGMEIYLCSSMENMVQELLESSPTVWCSVPLIMKRLYLNINDKILDCLKNIRILYCGGTFMEPEIKKFYRNQNVNLIEAYGTSETSSVIALELLGENYDIKSTGKIMENLSVKILARDDNGYGEILVKGGSVSSGYLDEYARKKSFDEEGYYHTGDIGKIDEGNHLYIKGRKRRVIITANAKNVYPDEIEEIILKNSNIKKVKVYEEDNKISCTIVSNLDKKYIKKYIDDINAELPNYKKIYKLYINSDEFGSRIK